MKKIKDQSTPDLNYTKVSNQYVIEELNKIMNRVEDIHGYQPHVPDHVLSDATQRKIFFDGWHDGRSLMKIDLINFINKLK